MKDRKILPGDVYFAKKTRAIILIASVNADGETRVVMLSQGLASSLAGEIWTNDTSFSGNGGHLFLYNLYDIVEETRQQVIDDVKGMTKDVS